MFENLLSNAWKHTRKTAVTQIALATEQQEGVTVFRMRDNDEGLIMRFADKLFGAFQRLHCKNEFEATGIGLAAVQRIIHRHDGHAWTTDRMGKGAH